MVFFRNGLVIPYFDEKVLAGGRFHLPGKIGLKKMLVGAIQMSALTSLSSKMVKRAMPLAPH